jgi:hypothetical protein
MKVECIKKSILTGIRSASGVEVIDGLIYIIGDDASVLYKINHELKMLDKIQLPFSDELPIENIPKKYKPDLECMATLYINDYPHIVILGSGSLSPQRYVAYLVKLPTQYNRKHIVWTAPVARLYEMLRKNDEITTNGEINIEGLAVSDNRVFLLNRGNTGGCRNTVLQFDKKEFVEFIQGHTEGVPFPRVFNYDGYPINGVPAYFTGADFRDDMLFYTAAAENTSNAYDDGAVEGSIVGYFTYKKKYTHHYSVDFLLHETSSLIYYQNKPYLQKIESMCIYEKNTDGSYTALAVTDTDGGKSEILMLEITI